MTDYSDKRRAAQTYRRLASAPQQQAEAIARHYASLAATAANLLHLIQASRFGAPEPAESLIAQQLQVIKDHHLADLGIELEWTADDTDNQP